jgi:AcrR family transcriptional regulator
VNGLVNDPTGAQLTGPGGTRTNALGEATRSRLIAEGERLFAEHGIASVTLKEVAQAAGQRNNTAIQYHFGNKEGLLLAITLHRARVTEQSRAEMLARAGAAGRGYTVGDLVAAMVLPLAVNLRPGDYYLRFQSRLVEERGGFQNLGDELPGAMRAIPDLLFRLCPEIPQTLMRHRFGNALISIIHTLARYQRLVSESALEVTASALVEDLIAVTSAGLTAPTRHGHDQPGAARSGSATATTGRDPEIDLNPGPVRNTAGISLRVILPATKKQML